MADEEPLEILEILLMRHGAGIKPGQDPEEVKRGLDNVLTNAGYRNAQAVGHTLAETLTYSYPNVRCLDVLYAVTTSETLPPSEEAQQATPEPRATASETARCLAREPQATAGVVAELLRTAGIRTNGPKQCDMKLPGKTLVTKCAQKWIESFAQEIASVACGDRPVLVVANSPQIDWVAAELLGRDIAINRSELVGIGKRRRRRWWSLRKRWDFRKRRDFLWAISADEKSEITDLREKIHSKMDTAKFLGTFITALVTFVLGKGFGAVSGNGLTAGLPRVQVVLWLITIAGLGLAALLCFAAVVHYDTLLMPVRFWASSARSPWFRFGRPPAVRRFVQRPPSSASRLLHQNMVRVWKLLVVAAMILLGVGLAAFAVLMVEKPRTWSALMWPVTVVVVITVVASSYLFFTRPHLGAQD